LGFDLNQTRINELREFHDHTLELSSEEIRDAKHLSFSSNINDLRDINIYIVTVPTPINDLNEPDLDPILNASKMIGEFLTKGDIVIYESTVYPGVTEEECVPVLEEKSKLIFNEDFFVGYSPERINPGDKAHRLRDIRKVTSGSTPEIADFIDKLYQTIIKAGTFKASSIRVAEAAKVIENTQRDVNIALINELSKIFSLLEIDTEEVLNAAGTKWNFLPFKPGLVGGHCIGVDPYYLTHKAQQHGYNPEIILAGRRLNDGMGKYVADNIIAEIKSKNGSQINNTAILILGLTFKENCPDLRNSKVFDIVDALKQNSVMVHTCDPWIDRNQLQHDVNLLDINNIKNTFYDGIILAVGHDKFRKLGVDTIRSFGRDNHVLYDLKHIFLPSESDLRL
jgi:UDP-N-acetyl-D-galactosamine dehydrogenase